MVLRASLVVLTALVLAWLGVLYRDARVGQVAADRIFYEPRLRPGEFDRQQERMGDARLLNPDRYWDITRAKYFLLRDRPRRALRSAAALVRAEPANLEAWIVLYQAERELGLSRRARQAAAEIRRLNPLIDRGRR
jgi:predicted Zn-dependent protease